MALTLEQRQNIIDQRLNGVPVATLVNMTGHGRATIVKVFREYLAEHAEDHAAEIEQLRSSLVSRHEHAAFTARLEGERARQNGDSAAHARYMKEERESLREVARLTGADLPVRVDVSGSVDVSVSVESARERLSAYLVGLCQSQS